MYKVFYNEKMLILSHSPLNGMKNLKFITESQFNEALAMLRNSPISELNIYYHNVGKLLNHFISHFDYIEAAGGVVENMNHEILLIYRLGKWDLPKGKVEEGETPQIAAIREVEEECSIGNLFLGDLITVTYHIYFQKTLKLKAVYWYKMRFEGVEIPKPQNEEGIEIASWIRKEDVFKLMDESYKNIQIVLEEYFSSCAISENTESKKDQKKSM